ncbi:MAG TPA: MFS transporter [Spirochaetia bacterium]|nr:MFS transporter [Spirochaetia bacterium]
MPISPILYLVSAAHFFNDIYMGFLTPLFPIAVEKFGLSLSMIGVVSMVAAMASALSQPVFGTLFDRFGVTSSVYLAPLLTGILISSLGVASSYGGFLVLLFLGCLGSAAFHPKGASVTPALSGKHPEIGMAVFSAGGNLGFAAGPAVIAFFISLWGFRATPVLALPAAAVALALFLLLPAREIERKTRSQERVTWRSLLSDPEQRTILARLVFINFALQVAVRGLQTFLPIYMTGLSVPITEIGVIFTVMLALGAVMSIFVSSFSRRTGKRFLIFLSITASVPLCLAGFLLMPSVWGYALSILGGIALTFSNPLLILFAQKHSGGSPAMASSLIMGISWGLAGLLMVPLGGLGELVGVKATLAAVSAFPLVSAVSCLRVPRE